MVDKLQVKEITQDPLLQKELILRAGNRHTTIEKKEVDRNRDGYLDCRYYRNPRQFLKWQNELFKAGLISRLYENYCIAHDRSLEFDYVRLEKSNESFQMIVYFGKKSQRDLFKSLNPNLEEMSPIPASMVERNNSGLRDHIDPNEPIPDNFFSQINEINQPEKGRSENGQYYRFNATIFYQGSYHLLSRLNDEVQEKKISGSSKKEQPYSKKDLFSLLENSNEFQRVSDKKTGDLVVWYRIEGNQKTLVHAFVDLGYGWILTKSRQDCETLYRFQRLENARHFYEQINDRAYSTEVLFNPLNEERYRSKKVKD